MIASSVVFYIVIQVCDQFSRKLRNEKMSENEKFSVIQKKIEKFRISNIKKRKIRILKEKREN